MIVMPRNGNLLTSPEKKNNPLDSYVFHNLLELCRNLDTCNVDTIFDMSDWSLDD